MPTKEATSYPAPINRRMQMTALLTTASAFLSSFIVDPPQRHEQVDWFGF